VPLVNRTMAFPSPLTTSIVDGTSAPLASCYRLWYPSGIPLASLGLVCVCWLSYPLVSATRPNPTQPKAPLPLAQ
jgi:hypothetical protein